MEYKFLVDSHCHLKNIKESGLNLDDVINESNSNNVKIINNICANILEVEDIIEITNKYKNVYCSIGHHPEELKNKSIIIDDLFKYKDYKKLIGIGESGLDYVCAESVEKNKQIENFLIHIEASKELNLPLIIHSRGCDDDMKNIIKTEIKNKEFSFVLHCFCSSEDLAKTALDCGGFISFSGILTFKNAKDLQSIAKNIPLDKILVETDAPFLAPVPYRGKINQPSYTKFTAEFLANLLNINFEEIQNITTKNFFKLFNRVGNIF